MSRGAPDHHVVITMPAYRAVRTLEKTVRAIPVGAADELILVDDASLDGTAELARDLGLNVYVHAVNRGYGGNQKTCYMQALRHGASIVVMLHPDYQYDPEAVPLLIAPILAGRADVTFGSRFAGLGDPRAGGMPLYRYFGNRLTTILENLMLGSRFTETHSGMRAYTREALLSLPFLRYSDEFDFDSQLLVDAITSGLLVVEVPIPTRYTKESSSIGIRSSLRYVWSSLTYCARRRRERGRRGSRWPVARMRRRTPVSGLAARSSPTPRPERVVSRPGSADGASVPFWTLLPQDAYGYAVRGARVTVLGEGPGSDRAGNEPASDVVVLSLADRSPGAEDLEGSSRILDEDGLLVVLLPPAAGMGTARRTAIVLAPRLAAAGYRLIEVCGPDVRRPGPSRRAAIIARLQRP